MKGKKAKENNPLIDLVRMTWRYSKGSERKVFAFLTLFIMAGTIDILVRPYAWSLIFDFVQTQKITTSNFPELAKLMFYLILSIFVFWTIHGPARILERDNAFQARINYINYMMRGTLALPVGWHSSHQTGDTIDRVNKGGDALYSFSQDSYRILYESINLIGSVGMLMWFFPMSGAVMLVLMSLCVYIVIKFDEKLMVQYKAVVEMQNAQSAAIYDSLSNIVTVIILRVELLIHKSIMRKAEKPIAVNSLSNKLNEIKWFLVSMCNNLMTVLILGGYLYHQASMSVEISAGSIFLLYRYLDKVGGVFANFAGMYSGIVQNRAGVMNAEELSKNFTGEGLTNHVLPQGWREISIRNLSFSYEDSSTKKHLDAVSFDIRRGEKVALVGKSGCGKSTFLRMVRGLYDPSSLDLSVDGGHVADGFHGISRAVSLIPQTPEIFVGTVLKNITLGAEYGMSEVDHAVRLAMFDEVLQRLPRGYASSINEKGVNLSVGEMQRLALARGLLASSGESFVLFDEPTSSLDGLTERKVYQNIFEFFADAAVISSIHRLHLLPMFDKVCFFGGGRIIAAGSFDELMQTCAEFREMYDTYTSSGESDGLSGDNANVVDC